MATFSFSKLETFKNCPRKFYYRYVAKVPLDEEPDHIATFLGSRVHETFQKLYERVRHATVMPERDLIAFYQQRWKAEWSSSVVVPEHSATPAEFRRLGEEFVRDYYRRYTPFNDARIIGLEKKIMFPLDEAGQHRMVGYIDRLARTPVGVWQIHDYKTNSRLPTQAEKDADPQLAYYEIGVRRMWPDVEQVELIWHFVRFDQAIRSTRTTEQLEALREETLSLIADIESRVRDEAAFPTHESKLCDYCEYQAICPVRKHLVAVKQLPKNKFLREPGVKLVDRWNDLKAKQDELKAAIEELESEIDEIREALLALAERQGMTAVVGSEKEVSIVQEQKVLFPRKGQEPDKAEELESRLRGSPWWEQVSSLDRNALAALWKERETQAAKLRKLLEEFAWTEDQTTIRLRNRRG